MGLFFKIFLIIEIISFSSGVILIIFGLIIGEEDVVDVGGLIVLSAILVALFVLALTGVSRLIQLIFS